MATERNLRAPHLEIPWRIPSTFMHPKEVFLEKERRRPYSILHSTRFKGLSKILTFSLKIIVIRCIDIIKDYTERSKIIIFIQLSFNPGTNLS